VEQFQPMVEDLIGSYGWIFIAGVVGLMFKSLITSVAEGAMIRFGGDIDLDDILYINGRKTRVIRQSLRRTYFHVEDEKYGKFKTVLIVPNDRFKYLTVERHLPDNGKA